MTYPSHNVSLGLSFFRGGSPSSNCRACEVFVALIRELHREWLFAA
jgi:hypothetical protein